MRLILVDELIAQLAKASSNGHLHAALSLATERMGFDHFALSYDRRPGQSGTHRFLLHDYPEAWARSYICYDLAGIDPVITTSQKSSNGFRWNEMERFVALTRSNHHLMDLASDHGLADGYTVPRHVPGEGLGSCTFVVNPDRTFPESMRFVAELVGAWAVHNALRCLGDIRNVRQPHLSERQLECLIWSARGRTNAEIGVILSISEHTVIYHLKAACERYNVHSRLELILCAVSDGLISFADIFDWHQKH